MNRTARGAEEWMRQMERRLAAVERVRPHTPLPMVTSGALAVHTGAANRVAWGQNLVWLLDPGVTEALSATTQIPLGGPLDVFLLWSNAGSGTGNVVWHLETLGLEVGASLVTPGTVTATTVAAPGLRILKETRLAQDVQVSGLRGFTLSRMGGSAADTLPNDAAVLGLVFRRSTT